jgi:tetratricopeptide (TPR) repeat protein
MGVDLRRLLTAAILAAAVPLLAWASLQQMAVYRYAGEPERVLRWSPQEARALAGLADRRFNAARTDADFAEAARLARQALARDPMETSALRVLALDADRREDAALAGRLMGIVGRRSLRDTFAQTWLYEHALERGDHRAADAHADAILRRRPEFGEVLFPAIIDSLSDPRAAAPLAAQLARGGEWRTPFLAALNKAEPDLESALRLFDAMAATSAPLTDAEGAAFLKPLVDDKDYASAHRAWKRMLGRDAVNAGLLYDGEFRGLRGAPPFNWRLIDGGGVISELSRTEEGVGALHIQAPVQRSDVVAEQVLSLPPGVYRLSGEGLVEGTPAGDPALWRLECLDDASLLGEARVSRTPDRWSGYAMTVQVPPSACAAQLLRLVTLAQPGFGALGAWHRRMRIDRVPSAGG